MFQKNEQLGLNYQTNLGWNQNKNDGLNLHVRYDYGNVGLKHQTYAGLMHDEIWDSSRTRVEFTFRNGETKATVQGKLTYGIKEIILV